jgi:hypothetical protein
VLASNWKPPIKKGFATKAYFRGGGGLFISFADAWLRRRRVPSDVYRVWFTAWRDIRAAAKAVDSDPIGFTSRMHFGYYLMIAALVLMGLEVLYALYQLATFL